MRTSLGLQPAATGLVGRSNGGIIAQSSGWNSASERRSTSRALLAQDLVGPFDQRDQVRRRDEAGILSAEIAVPDRTGPLTGGSDADRDFVPDRLCHDFGQGRPADGRHRVHQLVFHQGHRLAEEEYPDLVAGIGEGIGMKKREGRFGRIVGPPRALYQDLHLWGSSPREIAAALYPGTPTRLRLGRPRQRSRLAAHMTTRLGCLGSRAVADWFGICTGSRSALGGPPVHTSKRNREARDGR